MRQMRRVALRLVSAGRVRADIVGSEASVRASVEPGDFADRNLINFFFDLQFGNIDVTNYFLSIPQLHNLSKIHSKLRNEVRGLA